ncbi:MAG: chemotaxis protein CheW [Pseudomonadota bacterium]
MSDPHDTNLRKAESEFVTFTAADQSFCLDIMQIREIRRWTPVTILPHAPVEVLGVMNLRGAVIPIFDLAAGFGLGRTEADERNVIIVAKVEHQTVGLLVQSVSEILSVPSEKIQSTPDVKSDTTKQSIPEVISLDEGMTRVVDLQFVAKVVSKVAA